MNYSAKDWTEDFSFLNGNYLHCCTKCKYRFLGHKRRTICKKCSEVESPAQVELPELAEITSADVSLRMNRWADRTFELIDESVEMGINLEEGSSDAHAGLDAEWELIQRERQLREALTELAAERKAHEETKAALTERNNRGTGFLYVPSAQYESVKVKLAAANEALRHAAGWMVSEEGTLTIPQWVKLPAVQAALKEEKK